MRFMILELNKASKTDPVLRLLVFADAPKRNHEEVLIFEKALAP